jgi:hypothetical protein
MFGIYDPTSPLSDPTMGVPMFEIDLHRATGEDSPIGALQR